MQCGENIAASALLSTIGFSTEGNAVVRKSESTLVPDKTACDGDTALTLLLDTIDGNELRVNSQIGTDVPAIDCDNLLPLRAAIAELCSRGGVKLYETGTVQDSDLSHECEGISIMSKFFDSLVRVEGELCVRSVRFTGDIIEGSCGDYPGLKTLIGEVFTQTTEGYALVTT